MRARYWVDTTQPGYHARWATAFGLTNMPQVEWIWEHGLVHYFEETYDAVMEQLA